jgi:hypothetical protein
MTAAQSQAVHFTFPHPARSAASMGRFHTPDRARGNIFSPQRLNRYSYVRNDPVNRVDPKGLDDGDIIDGGDDPFELIMDGGGGGGGGGSGDAGGGNFDTGGFGLCDPTDPTCGLGTGGGCDPTVDISCGGPPVFCDPSTDPTCGSGCGPTDPLCGIGLGSDSFFGFSCDGTTDCSYYQTACALATTESSKLYYCHVAWAICVAAPDDGGWSDCVRLCLQQNDTCLNSNDYAFGLCQAGLHSLCFAKCAICYPDSTPIPF